VRCRSEDLLPQVYEELRRMASNRMAREALGHTLQPTALVHEVWLRLAEGGVWSWQNRAHFFGVAAEAMRRILIENARRKAAEKRGGGRQRVDLQELDLPTAEPEEELLQLNDALQQLELENPERARVVVLKFFGDLSNQEIAGTLGISERTVNRHWLCARTWLYLRLKTDLHAP